MTITNHLYLLSVYAVVFSLSLPLFFIHLRRCTSHLQCAIRSNSNVLRGYYFLSGGFCNTFFGSLSSDIQAFSYDKAIWSCEA